MAALCCCARLWNITRDNVSCLKGEANRRKAPSLKEFLAPVIMEMDPDEGIEEAYKVTSVRSPSTRRAHQSFHACLLLVCKIALPHGTKPTS